MALDLLDEVHRYADDFGSKLDSLTRAGLIVDADGQLALTETGKLVYDLVAITFYPEHAKRWLDDRQGHMTSAERDTPDPE